MKHNYLSSEEESVMEEVSNLKQELLEVRTQLNESRTLVSFLQSVVLRLQEDGKATISNLECANLKLLELLSKADLSQVDVSVLGERLKALKEDGISIASNFASVDLSLGTTFNDEDLKSLKGKCKVLKQDIESAIDWYISSDPVLIYIAPDYKPCDLYSVRTVIATLYKDRLYGIVNKVTEEDQISDLNELMTLCKVGNPILDLPEAVYVKSRKLFFAMLSYNKKKGILSKEKKEQREREKRRLEEEQRRLQELEEERERIEKEDELLRREQERLLLQKEKLALQQANEDFDVRLQQAVEAKLKQIEESRKTTKEALKNVEGWKANTRAGYVYIISNIGSFGKDVFKIGMTRRVNPMDRIDDLSDASVPFRFDVHAFIFSEDAPRLESILHRHFYSNMTNLINSKKEFFNVSLEEIKKVVSENFDGTVEWVDDPEALEFYRSERIRRGEEPRPGYSISMGEIDDLPDDILVLKTERGIGIAKETDNGKVIILKGSELCTEASRFTDENDYMRAIKTITELESAGCLRDGVFIEDSTPLSKQWTASIIEMRWSSKDKWIVKSDYCF